MLVVTLKVNINSRHCTYIFHQGKKCPNSHSTIVLADSYSSSSFVANMEVGSIPVFSCAPGGPNLCVISAGCPCCPLSLWVVSAGRGALCGTILGHPPIHIHASTDPIAYRCPMSTSCLRPGVPAAPCPCVLSRQGEERCVGQSSAGGLRHTATPPLLHFSVSSLSLVTAGSRAGARSCREETPALQHTAPLSSSLWYSQLQTVNCDGNWVQLSLPQPAQCLVKIGCELLWESHHLYVESKFWCCQFYYDSNSSTAQTQYCRRWGYSPLTLATLHIAITGTHILSEIITC